MTNDFWKRVDKDGPTFAVDLGACWQWLGSRTPQGYGLCKTNGVAQYTHRLAYEAVRGPIPTGLQIDHLCRNRGCCNPDHLEAVSNRENQLRVRRLITHCPRGHEYDAANTYVNKLGHRICRACHRDQERTRRRRLTGIRTVQIIQQPA